jgi:predicted Zn-dependent protease
VELAPDDPVLRVRFGDALTGAGRAAEAVEHLRRAVALEPAYAAGYESLGRALAASGERAAALDAYAAYLERAPRRDAARIAAVRRRVEALSAPPAVAPAPIP